MSESQHSIPSAPTQHERSNSSELELQLRGLKAELEMLQHEHSIFKKELGSNTKYALLDIAEFVDDTEHKKTVPLDASSLVTRYKSMIKLEVKIAQVVQDIATIESRLSATQK